MHPPLPGDKPAGFIGLIVGLVSIFIIVFGIVELTNRKFAGREGHGAPPAAPAAAAPTGAAPAPAQH